MATAWRGASASTAATSMTRWRDANGSLLRGRVSNRLYDGWTEFWRVERHLLYRSVPTPTRIWRSVPLPRLMARLLADLGLALLPSVQHRLDCRPPRWTVPD